MKSIFKGKFRVTSGYLLPDRITHDGLDMVGDENKNVFSVCNGVVDMVQIWDGYTRTGSQSYGNLVVVKGTDKQYYYYAHLKEIYVSKGESVSTGYRLGYMGNTGNSSGAHTHFEIRKADKKVRINPATFLGIENRKGATYVGVIDEAISDTSKLHGIDVSKHQRVIDWKKVKESGKVDFAIIRAGYGMYDHQKDSQFDNNVEGCTENNIPYGFYWYSYATTEDEALREAETCLKIIANTSPLYPVFFDQEYEDCIKKLSDQKRTDICKVFMDKILEKGYKTGLYCSYDWIKNWVDESQLTSYDKWIAQYSSSCMYSGSDLGMWQYSSKGNVDGISVNVDLNYCYKDYLETKKGWQKDDNGWWYKKTDGSYYKNEWLKDYNRWYYFDDKGYAVKGFQIIKDKTYYFAEGYALDKDVKECQLIMTDMNGEIV